MNGQPLSPEQIIQLVTPIFKGELDTWCGHVLFGRMWCDWEIEQFSNECERRGVDIIWNLLEKSHGDIGRAKEIWSPIDDFSAPTDRTAFIQKLDQVVEALLSGKRIFVHCWSGRGRTSLALASILVRLGSTPEDALQLVHKLAHGPETDIQWRFVRERL